MLLKGKIKCLSSYKGKSKFDFFNNIMEGDVLEATLDAGLKNRGGVQVATLKNLRSSKESKVYISELGRYIDKIEHEVIN